MSSSINTSYSSYSTFNPARPDPSQMASRLFSKLDTKGQGYLEQSDLQSAFEQIDGTSDSAEVASVFKQLDSDSDGKVTESELSSTLSKLAEELDNQFNQSRLQAAGGMPPPPPPGGRSEEAGFTQEELEKQLEEIGSTDSARSSLIASVVENFEAADSNGDGKVSFQEAMAYQEENAASSAGVTSEETSGQATQSEDSVMRRILQLVQAYSGQPESSAGLSSLLSTQA